MPCNIASIHKGRRSVAVKLVVEMPYYLKGASQREIHIENRIYACNYLVLDIAKKCSLENYFNSGYLDITVVLVEWIKNG